MQTSPFSSLEGGDGRDGRRGLAADIQIQLIRAPRVHKSNTDFSKLVGNHVDRKEEEVSFSQVGSILDSINFASLEINFASLERNAETAAKTFENNDPPNVLSQVIDILNSIDFLSIQQALETAETIQQAFETAETGMNFQSGDLSQSDAGIGQANTEFQEVPDENADAELQAIPVEDAEDMLDCDRFEGNLNFPVGINDVNLSLTVRRPSSECV